MDERIRQVGARVEQRSRRLDDLARDSREILDALNALGPKVDDALATQRVHAPRAAAAAGEVA